MTLADPHLQFEISSGQLSSFDATGTQSYLGAAYSGAPGFVNDVATQHLKGQGVIPVGWYSIGADIGTKGPYTLPLTPDPDTVTYGRGGFEIHAENLAKDENQSLEESIPASSEGCIVVPDHQARATAATYHRLLAVP